MALRHFSVCLWLACFCFLPSPLLAQTDRTPSGAVRDAGGAAGSDATSQAGEYLRDVNTVLLLHMNESGGSAVADSGGYALNGSLQNGVNFTLGRFGRALQFPNGGIVVVPHSSVLNLQDLTIEMWIYPMRSDFTLTGPDPGMGLVAKRTSNVPDPYTFMIGNGGTLRLNGNYASGWSDASTSAPVLRTYAWQHVAVTRATSGGQTTIVFYVNGVKAGESAVTVGAATANTQSLFIGRDPYFAAYTSQGTYTGLIDELRISDRSRAPEEFNLQLPPRNLVAAPTCSSIELSWENGGGAVPLMRYRIYRGADSTSLTLIDSTGGVAYSDADLPAGTRYFYRVRAVDSTGFESAPSVVRSSVVGSPTSGGEYSTDASTVALYHMNEGGGSILVDAGANGLNGSLSVNVSRQLGRFGGGTTFQGGGSYGRIPHDTLLNLQNLTIEMWLSPTMGSLAMTGADPGMGILSKRTANVPQPYTLLIGNGGTLRLNTHYGTTWNDAATPSPVLGTGRWQHVAVTRTLAGGKGTVIFYLNGRKVGESVHSLGGGATTNSEDVLVGVDPYFAAYTNQGTYAGLMDELRISSRARSAREFNLQLPPVGLEASSSGSTVDLAWKNGGGSVPLKVYRIYRGMDSTNVALVDSSADPSRSYSGLTPGTRYYYRVSAVDSTGFEGSVSSAIGVTVSATSVGETGGEIPRGFVLMQNFPSPFNPSTTIRFGLPQRTDVSLAVYNMLGQQVALLAEGEREAGFHDVRFDATGMASGVYFYQLKAGTFVETRRLLILR